MRRAQPGIYSGAGDYCACNNGKTYPVTSSYYPSTISGSRTTTTTTLLSMCGYTAPPAETATLHSKTTSWSSAATPTSGSASCSSMPPGATTVARSVIQAEINDWCAGQKIFLTSTTTPCLGSGYLHMTPYWNSNFVVSLFQGDGCPSPVGDMSPYYATTAECLDKFSQVIDSCK